MLISRRYSFLGDSGNGNLSFLEIGETKMSRNGGGGGFTAMRRRARRPPLLSTLLPMAATTHRIKIFDICSKIIYR